MAPRTQAEIDAIQNQQAKDIDEIKNMVRHMEEVVITGNGEPSLREQVRGLISWVNTVNKIFFVLTASVIGIILSTGCGMFFGVVILLSQNGLLKTP